MRLLVDDRWVGKHGIGRFADEVLRRLPPAISMSPGPRPSGPFDALWTSWKIARISPSVYFSPGYNPPFTSRVPFVFTVHDLIHLHVAEESSAVKRLYYERVVRPALSRAFKVLTVSNFSKQEIVDWSGIAPEKILVVGNGVSAGFVPAGPRHVEDRPYFLYIGNRRPHKNLPRLFRAFHSANLGRDVILLCSGIRDEVVSRWIREARLDESSVHFAERIPEERIADYYRGALAVLMPSLYEGFGLPVLEAMACGTPVLTSNRTSLPEMVGDAGLLVDPTDEDEMATSMKIILENSTLRATLSSKGPLRAREFNWEATAMAVLGVIRAAVR